MKHTAVKGIACSMVNSPLICLHGPRIQNPEAVKKLHLGVLDSTSQPVSWMFGCFSPPDETLMILISQPLTCFVETLLRNTFVYTFVLGCRDDLFFCPYCVSYYISCSWNLSFAPWGGSPTWKGCLHTPPVVHVDRLVSFPSLTIGDPSYIHRSSEETAYHQLDVKWGTKVVWMSLL